MYIGNGSFELVPTYWWNKLLFGMGVHSQIKKKGDSLSYSYILSLSKSKGQYLQADLTGKREEIAIVRPTHHQEFLSVPKYG
jgi:hypothetical protein